MRNPRYPSSLRDQPLHAFNGMDVSSAVRRGFREPGEGLTVTSIYAIDPTLGRPLDLAESQSWDHPRRIVYRAPAAARALAMALERPNHSISGLSALAVFGLPFFADHCDTTLAGPVRTKQAATAFTPHVSHLSGTVPWIVTYRGLDVRISPPADAVVEAIRHIRSGLHSWRVLHVEGLTAVEVRCIQVLDMARRHLGVRLEDVVDAAARRLNRRWLAILIGHSSRFADSPKETEMRLLSVAVCKELQVFLVEQLPLYDESRLITVFDLALPDLKIALMYDGEHHLERTQRDKDSRIGIECALRGWLVIRVTAGTLADIPQHLRDAVRSRMAA